MEFNIKSDADIELIRKTPRWLLHWGGIVSFMVFVCLLIISAIIPYKRDVRFPVSIIADGRHPTYIIARSSGVVIKNSALYMDFVKTGDTVLAATDGSDSTRCITAPISGRIYYTNLSLTETGTFKNGDTLLRIDPLVDTSGAILAIGNTKYLNFKKNNLHVSFPRNSGNPVDIKAKFRYSSQTENTSLGHTVILELDGDGLSKHATTPWYQGMKGTAIFEQEEKSMLKWFINK